MLCLRHVNPFYSLIKIMSNHSFDLIQTDTEKFPPFIDFVYLVRFKGCVQRVFQRRSILRKNQRMDIKAKRYRCVTQFLNPIHGFQSPRHADFIDVLPKGANIANNIYISCLSIGLPIINVGNGLGSILQLSFQIVLLFQ